MNILPKCLLVSFYTVEYESRNENLGLEKLMTSLESNGMFCSLLYQKVKSFEDTEQLGDIVNDIVSNYGFDVIGSPVYSTNIAYVDRFFSLIKERKKQVITFTGGFLATTSTNAVLNYMNHVDYILCGSSVRLIVDFVSNLNNSAALKKMCNIAFKEKEQTFINQRTYENVLDDLSALARRDLIKSRNFEVARLQTSRGCTSRCAFCTESEKWIGKSPESIVFEMKQIIDLYNINTFNIVDSSFEDPTPGFGKDRIKRLCELIINNDLDVFFSIYSRAESYTDEDYELLDLMKKAGLITIFIGIESGNDETLKLFNKRASVANNTSTISMMKELKINLEAGFIMFHPYETLDQLMLNLDFFKNNMYIADNISSYTNSLFVYPDTKIHSRLKKDGMLSSDYSIANPQSYIYIDDRVRRVKNLIQSTDTLGLYRLWEYLQQIYNMISKAEKYDCFREISVLREGCDEIKLKLCEFNISFFQDAINLVLIDDVNEMFNLHLQQLVDGFDVQAYVKKLDRIKNSFIKQNIRNANLIIKKAK